MDRRGSEAGRGALLALQVLAGLQQEKHIQDRARIVDQNQQQVHVLQEEQAQLDQYLKEQQQKEREWRELQRSLKEERRQLEDIHRENGEQGTALLQKQTQYNEDMRQQPTPTHGSAWDDMRGSERASHGINTDRNSELQCEVHELARKESADLGASEGNCTGISTAVVSTQSSPTSSSPSPSPAKHWLCLPFYQ